MEEGTEGAGIQPPEEGCCHEADATNGRIHLLLLEQTRPAQVRRKHGWGDAQRHRRRTGRAGSMSFSASSFALAPPPGATGVPALWPSTKSGFEAGYNS